MTQRYKLLILCLLYYIIVTTTLTAYASPPVPTQQIIIQQLPGVAPEAASEIQQATDATIELFTTNTGMSLEKPVVILLVPNRETYITQAIALFHISELEAQKWANGSDALSGRNLIVVNISKVPTIRKKTFLLAHELTHQYQRQIAGNQAGQVMWLLEGMAETMGAEVVAKQGYFRMDQYKNNWESGLRLATNKPTLQQLRTREGWSQAVSQYGTTITYKVAGLATLILTEKFGQGKVLDYFKELARGIPPEIAFQNTFGITMADYENDFMNSLPLAS